jgi:hypothetical protein
MILNTSKRDTCQPLFKCYCTIHRLYNLIISPRFFHKIGILLKYIWMGYYISIKMWIFPSWYFHHDISIMIFPFKWGLQITSMSPRTRTNHFFFQRPSLRCQRKVCNKAWRVTYRLAQKKTSGWSAWRCDVIYEYIECTSAHRKLSGFVGF